MKAIVKKTYGGASVAFEPLLSDQSLMVNATQMAKIFKREVRGFLKTEQTRKFVEAYCRAENIPSQNEFTPKGKVIRVVSSGRNNGTWMNRIAALKFAAWLDPDFEVWVFKAIEEIMFGFSREQDQSIERTIVIQNELTRIEKKNDSSPGDLDRYLKLQNELKHERTLRSQATKRRFREFYHFLSPNFKTN